MAVYNYYVADVKLECPENPIVLGDGKCLWPAPHDFEILGIVGCILNAGTGAGTSTIFQIRNQTKGFDYYLTRPEFRVDDKDANNRAELHNGILGTRITGKQGNIIALDCDGLPGGADSVMATLWLLCGFWREAT